MGWGKKTTGAAPQPVRQDLTPEITETVTGFDREPFVSAAAGFDDAGNAAVMKIEKPTDSAKAQIEWHRMKSKKGWTDATLLLLLYEFVQHQGLFGDLVKFTRRR